MPAVPPGSPEQVSLAPRWAVILGGAGEVSLRQLAVRPDGVAVAVGAFDGALSAGAAVQRDSAGAGDGFALAVDPRGQVAWLAPLDGPAGDELSAVVAAPDGSVAVAGFATGTARLGGRAVAPAGQPGALVARLDPAGRPLWVTPIGATEYAAATAVAFTPDGHVLAAGYFAGTLDSGASAAGELDAWVAGLDGATGAIQWLHTGGGPGADAIHALAVAPSGAAHAAGSFTRWADFAGSHLVAVDDSEDGEPFVAAVGAGGLGPASAFDAEGGAVVAGLAPLPGGDLAAALTFGLAVQPGGDSVLGSGPSDGLVVRLAPGGAPRWVRRLGGAGADSAAALAVDRADRLWVTGSTGGAMEVEGRTVAGLGRRGGYLLALNADGDLISARALGGAGQAPSALASGPGGVVLVGGSAAGRVELPGQAARRVQGASDGWLVCFAARARR